MMLSWIETQLSRHMLDIAHYDLEVMECLYIMRVRVLHKRTWGDYKWDKKGTPN